MQSTSMSNDPGNTRTHRKMRAGDPAEVARKNFVELVEPRGIRAVDVALDHALERRPRGLDPDRLSLHVPSAERCGQGLCARCSVYVSPKGEIWMEPTS